MNSNIELEKAIKFVDESSGGKDKHFVRTLFWTLELKPDADISLQIAAYSHDIQRVFAKSENRDIVEKSEKGFMDEKFLEFHQIEGGRIMEEFLLEHNAPIEIAKKVNHLISKHEVGGDSEQNILKDADSISYFEINSDYFITKYLQKVGHKKVKEKFDWMFNRITGDTAKEIVKPMYESALQKLNNFKKNDQI